MSALMIRTANLIDNKLWDLATIIDEDNPEDYTFRPSSHALQTTKEIFGLIPSYLNELLPEPRLVPDGEEGISINWVIGDRRVNIGVFSDGKTPPYLYYRGKLSKVRGSAIATEENISKYLSWLVTGNGH